MRSRALSRARRLVRFLKRVEIISNTLGLLAILAFVVSYLSSHVLNNLPATGGDTGSHYWPLHTLVNTALPRGTVRVWNPGNLGGEPHFIHYFPGPYFIMALLSAIFPIGTAFNLGTVIPALLLPLAAYCCVRGLGLRFPSPLIAAASSLFFLFNEGNSMWGGNFLSLLAGQFAHAYAICLLLLGLGLLGYELRKGSLPVSSSLFFAAVACSHWYVFLGLPFFLLSVVLFFQQPSLSNRIKGALFSACAAVAVSLWFLFPMIGNDVWTTPFAVEWESPDFLQQAVPLIFYPVLILLLCLPAIIIRWRKAKPLLRRLLLAFAFWLLPSIAYLGLYFIFPLMGLFDARAVPQIQLFACMGVACCVGIWLRHWSRLLATLCALPLVLLSLWWTDSHVTKLNEWVQWNYSGWTSKPLNPALKDLSLAISGDFTDPRVVFEHNELSSGAGTVRVFEMLPYFSGRATLESVYLQATILAPQAFHIQALISKTPSCPFRQYECVHYDIASAEAKLRLLGVAQLILMTTEIRSQADSVPWLIRGGNYGPWTVYHMQGKVGYVGIISEPPQVIPYLDWKQKFYDWFKAYAGSQPFLVVRDANANPAWSVDGTNKFLHAVSPSHDLCKPSVDVDFNRISLKTSCPGKAHYLSFAYHPTFKADSGDPIFLLSPGIMGIVPSKPVVTIEFGHSLVWTVTSLISWASLLALSALAIWDLRKRRARSGWLMV